jgi:hypothetical protein
MNRTQPRLWRSRWAAIGAAVAVTLGAGGLATTFADSAPSSLVAISPVRVLDTRLEAMGPALTSATPRLLDVTGTIPTVGADGTTITPATVVPDGATAIVANVTIVGPTTPGFVAIRPGTATGDPTTSSLNATAAGVVVPNSVTVELPTTGTTTGQIQLWFQGTDPAATTHLLVDIVGYYQAGAAGPPGPAGLNAWQEIPSGTTVTGVASVNSVATAGGQFLGYSVMFPGRAPAPLTSDDVSFGAGTGSPDDDPECTGTTSAPTAPPGKVCIYPYGQANVQDFDGSSLQQLPDHGFYLGWTSTASGDLFLWTTWAYTAP